jgi:hypothetical protein
MMLALSWAMLVTGAGLSGFGLLRALARLRDRQNARLDDDGEIVLGAGRLAAGQPVVLARIGSDGLRDASRDTAGAIVEMTGKHCVIALDPDSRSVSARGQAALAGGSALRSPGGGRRPTAARGGADSPGGEALAEWSGGNAPGAMVWVTVTAASELYRFTARIRDAHQAADGVRVVVARPAALTRIQRRRHFRVGLKVPATFERVSAPGSSPSAPARGGPVHGAVHDLSAGGLRAHVGGVLQLADLDMLLARFTPGATVRIGLPFPALPGHSVLARVLSSSRAAAHGGLTLQIACEFLPMSAWEQEIVIGHVFELQREQLRARRKRPHDSQPSFCQ